METPILVDSPVPGVKRVTFNRPQKLNAFSWQMYKELEQFFADVRYDTSTRVVIVTGAGRGFSAGHDNSGTGGEADWVPKDVGAIQKTMFSLGRLSAITTAIRTLPQPVIAAVNGPAAGVGYSIALAADLTIAAQSARFVNAFHNAGTGSELGLAYMLPRTVGKQRGAELLLTARPVAGEEAERIGLVLRCVPDADLMKAALEIAENIMVNAPLDVWLTKQALWAHQHIGSIEASMDYDLRATAMVNQTTDAAEKRASYREKRKPKFDMK